MTGSTQIAVGSAIPGLTSEDIRRIAYYLQLTRQVEQVLTNLYRQNKIIGGLYRSLGQEAVAVGSAYALRRAEDGSGDVLAPAIRNLGSLFVMGARPAAVMSQYMAKADSPTQGREQNVHFSDLDRGYIGLISHLGVMIEVLSGVALSFKMRGERRVALTYIGDGGASTGAFHEGFNLAAVQRAPLVVIIENNGYAYSTPVSRQTAASSFVVKAAGYGVHGERCDGNDLFEVYQVTKRAVDRARAGEGASLLEVLTYRRLGHAEHDGQHYVPAGEIEAWEKRDPVNAFETRVVKEGWMTRAELDDITHKVAQEVEQARAAAEASPLPLAEGALAEVCAGAAIRVPWTRTAQQDPHLA